MKTFRQGAFAVAEVLPRRLLTAGQPARRLFSPGKYTMTTPSTSQSNTQPAAVRFTSRLLEYIGALLLFAMMMLTFVDVIARYFFSRSITGGFEVTEIMLATLIFCGLPLITLRDGHITVDLLEGFLGKNIKKFRDRFVYIMVAVVLAFLGYRLWLKGITFVEYNDQTAILYIPLAPVCFIMSVLSILSAAIATFFAITGNSPDKEDADLKPVTDSTVNNSSENTL